MKIANELLYPAPFYNFLDYISNSDVDGPILDCGSGGSHPKQALFVKLGFDTIGIELSKDNLTKAQDYAKEHNLKIPMQLGDMRSIDFESNFFGFVYSWHTIFHMSKEDCQKAVNEMIRVLKPGGICFVNFLSVDAEYYGEGEEKDPGEFVQNEHGIKVKHTFFKDQEPDLFFTSQDIEILYKEKRILYQKFKDRVMRDSYIDYIIQKKKI
jgi:SAM-dependent methyltransferase